VNQNPILPHQSKRGSLEYLTAPYSDLFYPSGLRQAQQLGYIVSIHYGFEFALTYCLKEHNEHFFGQKAEIGRECVVK
jgi:hypothetical protein